MRKTISINPSNNKVLGEVESSSEGEIIKKIDSARESSKKWKELGVGGRAKELRKVIKILQDKKEQFAQLASSEMGMPISLSRADIDDSIKYFEWYLDNAEEYLKPEVLYEDNAIKHTVYREPFGVSANIVPWNFPASNFVWSVGQTLVAGNTVVFKDSEEVILCGKFIEQIMKDADLPNGVFSEVYGGSDVGDFLVRGNIDLICFTGSTKIGKYLYKVASDKLIRVFLELGGSAPGIVFEDADIDRILDSLFANRFFYCGQVCDGLKRLIVHEKKIEEVVEKLTQKISEVKIGDALDEKTEIGPLVSAKQLGVLEKQVGDAIEKGAKTETGGKRPANLPGFFCEPTLLTNVKQNMRVWKEEVFGPVLPIVSFKTAEEAIDLANDTPYGLGGYVFTEDKERALRVAQKIDTGMVSVNNATYLKPCSPFGGYKQSGIGREHGKFGFHDLTQVKLIAEEK